MVFILCLVKIYNPYCKQICLIPVQNRAPRTGPFFHGGREKWTVIRGYEDGQMVMNLKSV